MKRIKNLLIVAMCALLVISPVMTETVSAAPTAKKTGTVTKKAPDGWITTSNGQRKYRKNNKFLKGCQFINRKYYFFDTNGVMQRKNVSYKGATYYIDNNGLVQGVRKGSSYLTPGGRKLTSGRVSNLRAYQSARNIVNRITNKRMSKAEKLKVCYRWMMSNGYGGWRKLSDGGEFWYAVNANDLFDHRRGDCISYACAMAYFAKVIGYDNVNVCSRDTRQGNHHTWTEINGRVYDPYFGKEKGADKYYGIPYSRFDYNVVFRQRIL